MLHTPITPAAAVQPEGFGLTLEQRATYRALKDRLTAAMALHEGKAWRVSRAKRLRGVLNRHAQTNDRRYFARFLTDFRAAIDSECRFLEDSAPVLRGRTGL